MVLGFIGLGIMGKPMARNLLKAGHKLLVWNRSPGPGQELASEGAQLEESVAALAQGADIIFTMLPNSPEVKAVVLEQGVLSHARPGSIVVDSSSIDPMASREIAAALQEKGIEMLDAPVSGGENGAIAGTLSFMVGGKQEVFDRVKPYLEAMGAAVTRCGEVGAGNVTKLCNQVMVASNLAGLAEALVLGMKGGVKPEVIIQATSGGMAGSRIMKDKAPKMIHHEFQPGFRVDLHLKDMNNVLSAARALGAPTPMAALVTEMLKQQMVQGGEALDHSAISRYFELLGGTELKA